MGEDVEKLVNHQAPGGGGGPQHRDEGVLGEADSIRILVLACLGHHKLPLVTDDVPEGGDDAG